MKKNRILLTLTLVSALVVSSKSNAQNLTAIKNEIVKDNALYFDLFKKNDPSIVNLYTDDGILMPPNTLAVRGKSALIKDFNDTYDAGTIKGVKFATLDIYGDGVLYVTEEGTWQLFGIDNKVIDNGKYLKLWKRTKNGWRIFRDVFNSDRKSS